MGKHGFGVGNGSTHQGSQNRDQLADLHDDSDKKSREKFMFREWKECSEK
jgi:hypothetical protein